MAEPQKSHLNYPIQVGFCFPISKIAVKTLFKAFTRIQKHFHTQAYPNRLSRFLRDFGGFLFLPSARTFRLPENELKSCLPPMRGWYETMHYLFPKTVF
ncbi:hypothetical protein [Wielerella bovis]|uniref:hypothetical protein n=1 Tax=Wielerella bovis TaxID=2917790 RepID=UPI002019677E|nr:hypothetical protein [Wielerella bovis]ULJ61059.1 hypothetical protein MIS44_04175 [Wielerella bovis]